MGKLSVETNNWTTIEKWICVWEEGGGANIDHSSDGLVCLFVYLFIYLVGVRHSSGGRALTCIGWDHSIEPKLLPFKRCFSYVM